jgi:hypothetical protein
MDVLLLLLTNEKSALYTMPSRYSVNQSPFKSENESFMKFYGRICNTQFGLCLFS